MRIYCTASGNATQCYVCVCVCVCVCVLVASHIQLFATPWTVACQAPLSMEFTRQEYWCGLPFPSPGDLLHRGIEPGSPALQAYSLPSEPSWKPSQCSVMTYMGRKSKKAGKYV